MILPRSPLQTAQEVALHGSGADPLPPSQAAPVDAVQVLLKDHLLKALAGPLERLNAWNGLPEPAAAIQTAALAHAQLQPALPETPVVVTDAPPAEALVSQTRSATLRARYRPGVPGRYRDDAAATIDRGNLILGQAQNDL